MLQEYVVMLLLSAVITTNISQSLKTLPASLSYNIVLGIMFLEGVSCHLLRSVFIVNISDISLTDSTTFTRGPYTVRGR